MGSDRLERVVLHAPPPSRRLGFGLRVHVMRAVSGLAIVLALAACGGAPEDAPTASTVRQSTESAGAADVGQPMRNGEPAAAESAPTADPVTDEAASLEAPDGGIGSGADPGPREASPAGAPSAAAADAGGGGRRVRTVRAATGQLTATRNASATIEAGRESQVAAGTSGRVARIHTRPGALVAAGAVVVSLDDAQLRSQVESAELSVQSAEVSLLQAQRQSSETIEQLEAQLQSAATSQALAQDRYQEGLALLEAGGISRVDLRSLEAQRDQAQSSWVQARDALARARRATGEDLRLLQLQVAQARNQLAQARDALDEAQITAPFDGEVADVFVEEGEFVGAGSPAFRLIAQDERRATFAVPAEDAQRLEEQGMVYIRHAGLDYAAQIARVTRSAQEPRLVQLSADLYPADDPIPAGTVAQLRYTIPLASGVAVPSAALAAEAGTTFVFVVDGGVARRTPVRVIAEAGARAVVEGLPEGARVISPRPLDVREGTRVEAVDE